MGTASGDARFPRLQLPRGAACRVVLQADAALEGADVDRFCWEDGGEIELAGFRIWIEGSLRRAWVSGTGIKCGRRTK